MKFGGVNVFGRKRVKNNDLSESAPLICGVNLYALLLLSCAVAFSGFVIENLFRLVSIGVIDDRHRLFPFLFEYGLGIFLIFTVFGTPKSSRLFKKQATLYQSQKQRRTKSFLSMFVYFAVLFVSIQIAEISVGLFVEKTLGIKGWNFSNIPLHITRYTSIPTAFAYSTGITLFMEFFFEKLIDLFCKIPPRVLKNLTTVLLIMITADFLVMLRHGALFGKYPSYWRIKFKRHLKIR